MKKGSRGEQKKIEMKYIHKDNEAQRPLSTELTIIKLTKNTQNLRRRGTLFPVVKPVIHLAEFSTVPCLADRASQLT